jgi:hypothetical protein
MEEITSGAKIIIYYRVVGIVSGEPVLFMWEFQKDSNNK